MLTLPGVLKALRKDILLQVLLVVFVILSVLAPERIAGYPELVDWPTIAALAGLLTLTRGVEMSGTLHHLGAHLIRRMPTERALALTLVAAAALLSTVLTNDVALFVVVPLTVALRRVSAVPVTRLVVFEALAVNAGSALTPLGNPQNLFLWQLSGVSFGQFVVAMLPLTLLLMVPLLVLTAGAFAGRAMHLDARAPLPTLQRPLLIVSLALYAPFLVLTDMHHAPLALLLVLGIFLIYRRAVPASVDWPLILVFILMFIDLRLVAQLPLVHTLIGAIDLADGQHLYLAGIAASQLISNVPAAILLAEYSRDWRMIAHAVNVGGFGFVLGSLANIIALRMSGDRRAWIAFHAWSLPFLLLVALLVDVWLFRA